MSVRTRAPGRAALCLNPVRTVVRRRLVRSTAGAHVSATGTSCSRLRSRAMASTSMTSVGVRTSLSVTIATAKLVRHSMRAGRDSRRAPCWRGGCQWRTYQTHFGSNLLNKLHPGSRWAPNLLKSATWPASPSNMLNAKVRARGGGAPQEGLHFTKRSSLHFSRARRAGRRVACCSGCCAGRAPAAPC